MLRSFAIFLGFVWFVQFSMPHLINTEQMEQDLQKLCSIFPFRDLCFSCIDVYVLLLFRVLLTVACVSCISSKFHCFLSCFCIYCVLFFMSKFVLHALSNCSIYCSMVFACLASLSQAPLFNKHHTDKGPAEALLHVLVLTTLCWRAPTSSPSDLKPLGAPD